jgi:hypothetical protein
MILPTLVFPGLAIQWFISDSSEHFKDFRLYRGRHLKGIKHSYPSLIIIGERSSL